MSLRPIAIYLPQFHPISENDQWWGKGFTEWTNVVKAKPLFNGHYQPHLPADLGFYDLRLPEARKAQADLAKEYGIYGFCYYHYWFNGKRILERPFREVFETGKPDFPFMLCWANENWTRVWDGGEKNVLLQQNYSFEDDLEHIKSLVPYFKDPRYIRIDNKPVFAIYKSALFPDIKRTIAIWRDEAKKNGLELYLCRFETLGAIGADYMKEGFDAAIEFQPHGGLEEYFKNMKQTSLSDKFNLENFRRSVLYRFRKLLGKQGPEEKGIIFNYKDFIDLVNKTATRPAYKKFPCITPGWDNSARRDENFLILNDSTPQLFKEWTVNTLREFKPYSPEENLFFINAWNEWAEGNHLEPCQKWGRQYLEALREALANSKGISY